MGAKAGMMIMEGESGSPGGGAPEPTTVAKQTFLPGLYSGREVTRGGCCHSSQVGFHPYFLPGSFGTGGITK